MPGNMDERVVSMEFDNRNFERNVRKSMKTIDDLKTSLDFDNSADSLDEINKGFKKISKSNPFAKMANSTENLKRGMAGLGSSATSLLGKFAEMTKIVALFDLANAAVRRLESSIKRFTIAPISEGFDKYTTKIGAIKTIANATKLEASMVNDELERLNWFTDETSASFGNMVENIGKFTSVGRGLSESITAMQGIATWGYQSGAGVAEINRAMYNLSQALGTGSVKLMDWKSIENAGMATKEFKEQAIAAAEAAGTLKRKGDKLYAGNQVVTTENFNSTLAKGWFTSDVLMAVLEQYGGFADELRDFMEKNPNIERASDAMEIMDQQRLEKRQKILDKYSEAWTKNSGKEIKDLDKQVTEINSITDTKEREKEIKKFAKLIGMSYEETKKILDELAETEESLGEKAFKASQQSKSLSDAINATIDAVSTGWMNSFQKIFGDLDESIALWTDVTDILWDLFASGASARNNALTHWAEEFGGRDDLWGEDGILHSIMDTIINLKNLLGESFKNVFFPDLEKALGFDTGALNTVSSFFGDKDLSGVDVKNGILTSDQIRFIREGSYMGGKIKEVTQAIKDFGITIRDFVNKNVDKFRQIFQSVATVVKFFGSIIGGVFSTIGNFLKNSGIVQDILNFATKVANKIKEIVERIQKSGFITTLFEKIGNTLTWFYTTLKNWGTQIYSFLKENGIIDAIENFFKGIGDFFLGGSQDVDANGKKTESAFFRAFGWIQTVKDWIGKINLKDILNDIKLFIDNFGKIWGVFTSALNGESAETTKGKADEVPKKLSGIVEFAQNIGKKLSGVAEFFKNIWGKFTGWLESSGILPWIRNAWQTIKDFFGNIGLIWDVFVRGKKVDPKDLNKSQVRILDIVYKFLGKAKNLVAKVKTFFTNVGTWISDKWQKFIQWLNDKGILPKIKSIWQTVKDFFGNIGLLWDIFVNKQGKYDPKDLTDDQLSIVQKIERFINNIKEKFEWIKQKFTEIKDKVVGWLNETGILPTLQEWWSSITGWFESLSVPGEGEGGPLDSVGRFFAGLYETVSGWFTGGEPKEAPKTTTTPTPSTAAAKSAEKAAEEKKPGFFGKMFANIKEAFTNDEGELDLVKGFSTSISEVFKLLGAIDWTGISTSVFDSVVGIINGLDDACGKLHINNILRVIQKVIGAFTGVMVFKGVTDFLGTIRAIVKKDKDKTTLERFTDFLSALGTALLQIGIAVALVAASMWLISKIDPKRFDAAKEIMLGIGVFFVGFLAVAFIMALVMGKNSDKLAKTFAAIGSMFIQIAVAIALIVASILIITLMLGKNGEISDKLRNAMLIVAGIMLVMVLMVSLMALLTKRVGTVSIAISIATFTGIAILLAVCVAAILLLQNVDPDKATDVIIKISGLLLVIVGLIVILNLASKKFDPKIAVVMITMAVMLALVVAALFILKDVQPGHLLETAGAIAIIMVALVAAIAVCSLLGPKALIGAAVLAGAIVIIAAGLAVVAALANGVMNNVVTVMSSLAAASNSAKLVDIDAISRALGVLPTIATGLGSVAAVDSEPAKALVRAARDVFTDLKLASFAALMVKEEQFHKVFGKDGKSGLLAIIQTGMSNITDTGWKASALGRNVETLAENLKLVGQAGADLAKDAGGKTLEEGIQIVKEKLTDIQEIVNMAIGMSTIGKDGTIDEDFLTRFSVGVGNIGAALKLYNEALATFETNGANGAEGITESDIAPVDSAAISRALESVMAVLGSATFDESQIAEVEKWGNLSSSTGGGTLFALGLTNIATAMTAFAKSAVDFNSGDVDKAIESLGKLGEIKAKFETNSPEDYKGMMDGVATWGDGGSFQTAIVGMGTAITAFGTTVKDLPADSVKKATDALDTLAVIYEKLKGEGTIENYIAKIGSLTIGGKTTTSESIQETFQGFAEGISKLADGLAAFSAALTDESIGYDQTKVDAAVKVLQDMSTIEQNLKGIKVDGNWWHDLLFGENGIKKLGEHMSGLGSRLSTFSSELTAAGGFDIDVNSDAWKNISGVIQFMADIWTQIAGIVQIQDEYNSEGVVYQSTMYNTAGNLEKLANGINKIREAMVEFNKAMQAKHEGGGGNLYSLGEWESKNWENIKTFLNTMKQMTIDLAGMGVKEGQFYDLMHFGYDVKELVNRLNESQLTTFMNRLDVPNDPGSVTAKFAAFSSCIKALVEATAMLHGQSISEEDVKSMTSIISALMSIDTSNWSAETLSLDGLALATQFVSGFATGLTQAEAAEGSQTIGTSMEALLGIIESYSDDFFEKGQTAGQQYASGFNQGLTSVEPGKLTPIISMDASGNASSGTSIFDILSKMPFATTADASGLALRLDVISNKFNRPISVDDKHTDIVNSIKDTNSRLKTIGENVTKLTTEVNNLKVYIAPNLLVGAIAADMDRELGRMANVSP